MDTIKTTKAMKALTVKQLLSKSQQGPRCYEDGKEIFERSGLIVFRGQMIIDVRQQAPVDDENRMTTMSRNCLNRFVSCGLVPDKLSESGLIRLIRSMVEDDFDRVNICQVNEQYRLTAERIGLVSNWLFGPSDGGLAIVGIDLSGHRRAVIACIE